MFKKLLATLLVFSVFSTKTNATEYIHGVGAGFDGLNAAGAGTISVQYLGRVNFVNMSDDMSIGLQFTPYVGYNLGVSGVATGISVGPEFSFGPAATKDTKAPIGFGISPIYHFSALIAGGAVTGHSAGFNAAFRFAAGEMPMSINTNVLLVNGTSVGVRYAIYF